MNRPDQEYYSNESETEKSPRMAVQAKSAIDSAEAKSPTLRMLASYTSAPSEVGSRIRLSRA